MKTQRDLDLMYETAEMADKAIFSEMRSNVLLAAGDHYSKENYSRYNNIRDSRLNQTDTYEKLRITKNHIHRVVRTYVNSLLEKSPGVKILPKHEAEMQDRKSAELNDAVWQDLVHRKKLDEAIHKWIEHFVTVGEVCVKVFWDPMKGDFLGYKGEVEVEDGEPPKVPTFSGDIQFENIPCFNILRDPHALTMNEAQWLMVRKMIPRTVLKKRYVNDEQKLNAVSGSPDDEKFLIFDANRNRYLESKNEILVKELYYKPCVDYPNGYFYIFVKGEILEEGELPHGLFPLVWCGFDEYPTNPRGHSIVRVARPFQAEINRAASQRATHQVTLGDDKLLYQSGSTLEQGSLLPGVRGIAYTGPPPQILAGRNGEQFAEYEKNQIIELERAVMLDKIMDAKDQKQTEPYSMLFKSMTQQATFKPYVEKFSKFLVATSELALDICRKYYDDNRIVLGVGRAEQINIKEFKGSKKLNHDIKVEERVDTMDTVLGKMLNIQSILQYKGKELSNEDLAMLFKQMPYVNETEMFGNFTLDYDAVTNDLLAIERGEDVDVSQYANNLYYIKRVTQRIKQADFKLLDKAIQDKYYELLNLHEGEEARKQQALIDAKNEYIPTDGMLVNIDMYVEDPNSSRPKKAKLPQRAVQWLFEKLDAQGADLQGLEKSNDQNQISVMQKAKQMPKQGGPQGPKSGSLRPAGSPEQGNAQTQQGSPAGPPSSGKGPSPYGPPRGGGAPQGTPQTPQGAPPSFQR